MCVLNMINGLDVFGSDRKLPHVIPSGSSPVGECATYGGYFVVMAVERKIGEENFIGVSDNMLAAVLTVLGDDPVSDKPEWCGERAWWWFLDDENNTIRKKVQAYCGTWRWEPGHLSFVRQCRHISHAYSQAAKENGLRRHYARPGTMAKHA